MNADSMKRKKVMAIGLDGVPKTLLDELLAAEKMPRQKDTLVRV